MKNKIITVVAILIVFLLTSSVLFNVLKKDDDSNLTKVKVAEVAHSIFYAPQYVAISEGFFEEYGIEYYVQNDMLVIESSRKSKLQILSLSGQQVHACGLLEGRNEICCLPQGVYLLRIGNKVAKVLIN